MAISIGENSGITGLKVESPGKGTASKSGGPSVSRNDIEPF